MTRFTLIFVMERTNQKFTEAQRDMEFFFKIISWPRDNN